MPTDHLFDPRDVADLIGMSVDHVWEMCRRGEVPHLRFGRTIRFRPETIEEWLLEREHGSMRR